MSSTQKNESLGGLGILQSVLNFLQKTTRQARKRLTGVNDGDATHRGNAFSGVSVMRGPRADVHVHFAIACLSQNSDGEPVLCSLAFFQRVALK